MLTDAPITAVFRALSRLRNARIFHPYGVAFTATWDGGGDVLPRGHDAVPAVVRLSQGIGLYRGSPDLLGVAVKVVDAHGPGQDQDLLVTSVGTGRVGRRVLRPARRFPGTTFSSILPYDTPWGRAPVLADVAGSGPGTVASMEASGARHLRIVLSLGHEHDLGTVQLDAPLAPEIAEDLRFDPWHTGPALRPAGVLNRVRRPAYQASQAGRGAPARGAHDRLRAG